MKNEDTKEEEEMDPQAQQTEYASAIAATGSIAMLTYDEDVCRCVGKDGNLGNVLDLLVYKELPPDLEIRAVTICCNLIHAETVHDAVKKMIMKAMNMKRDEQGFKHPGSEGKYQQFAGGGAKQSVV